MSAPIHAPDSLPIGAGSPSPPGDAVARTGLRTVPVNLRPPVITAHSTAFAAELALTGKDAYKLNRACLPIFTPLLSVFAIP